jgi:DNA-binding MarR family transcriptional regulator
MKPTRKSQTDLKSPTKKDDGCNHDIAHKLFDIFTQLRLSTFPVRWGLVDITEAEFLTLVILKNNGTMIVGNIQRILGVLPAQMSRIINSLEKREHPLIQCLINTGDKRKIDVCLTTFGEQSISEYQSARVGLIAKSLQNLSGEHYEDVIEALNKLSGCFV